MNMRKSLYFFLVGLRGHPLGKYYRNVKREYEAGILPDTIQNLLIKMLKHCEDSVPYYSKIISELGGAFQENPIEYLRNFPIMTKDILRKNFNELKSADLSNRKWFYKASGGSTGEPVHLIQDRDYAARTYANKMLFSEIIGREIGESEVYLWGSDRDIFDNTESWKARFLNKLTNTKFLNVYQLTPKKMLEYIKYLNERKPTLIVAYVHDLYELARFAEKEGVDVQPQNAIITSAGTLVPFMRTTIERVFKCRVFNHYGTREVGTIASEIPGRDGLLVAPWGNFIEIVDQDGQPVQDGMEGDIIITSLNNYAMPMIRYYIGDRGVLMPKSEAESDLSSMQVLQEVRGRTVDRFINKDGIIIDSIFFNILFSHEDWIAKHQVRQKTYSHLIIKIVKIYEPSAGEIENIIREARKIMADADCTIEFDFVDEILPSASGKYLYSLSDIDKSEISKNIYTEISSQAN